LGRVIEAIPKNKAEDLLEIIRSGMKHYSIKVAFSWVVIND